MFRLITFFVSAACLAAFVWFGLTVDLGRRTLFGHMRAITGSEEARELGEGIKEKVDDFVGIEAARRAAEKAREKGGEVAEGARGAAAKAGPPQDEHSEEDRDGLRKVMGKSQVAKEGREGKEGKEGKAARPERRYAEAGGKPKS